MNVHPKWLQTVYPIPRHISKWVLRKPTKALEQTLKDGSLLAPFFWWKQFHLAQQLYMHLNGWHTLKLLIFWSSVRQFLQLLILDRPSQKWELHHYLCEDFPPVIKSNNNANEWLLIKHHFLFERWEGGRYTIHLMYIVFHAFIDLTTVRLEK